MSTDIFALLIGVGLVITFAFYTAGLWIQLRIGSRCAFTPPAPPALPIDRPRGSTWKEIRASIETDLDEVIDRKQKAVVMSALDYAHAVGFRDGGQRWVEVNASNDGSVTHSHDNRVH